jgi:hypothetical protein
VSATDLAPDLEPTAPRPALLEAATVSWLTMMFTGSITMRPRTAREFADWADFAIIFMYVMSIPLAMVALGIYMPVFLLVRRSVHRLSLLLLVGVLAAPVAGFILLVIGALIFSREPTIFAAIARMAHQVQQSPSALGQLIAPLAVGGASFGVCLGVSRLNSGRSTASPAPSE